MLDKALPLDEGDELVEDGDLFLNEILSSVSLRRRRRRKILLFEAQRESGRFLP